MLINSLAVCVYLSAAYVCQFTMSALTLVHIFKFSGNRYMTFMFTEGYLLLKLESASWFIKEEIRYILWSLHGLWRKIV